MQLHELKTQMPKANPQTLVAKFSVLEHNGDPSLFLGDLGPGSQVLLGVQMGSAPITISFDGRSPFIGVERSICLNPGPPVPFTIRHDARGHYVFTVEGLLITPGAQLAVSADAPISKIGFQLNPAQELTLQAYVKGLPGELVVTSANLTDRRVTLKWVESEKPERDHRLEPRMLKERLLETSGFGVAVAIRLQSGTRSAGTRSLSTIPDQSGGTEQIEIIVEPDS